MSSNDEPRPGKPVVGHKVKGRAPIGWRPSPGSAPSAEAAPAARLAPSLTDVAEGFRNDPANDPSIPSNDVRPNGDQIDFRMVRIEEILRHAGMHLLEKCGRADQKEPLHGPRVSCACPVKPRRRAESLWSAR
jgi:hypothetical protein